ncbi:nicotinate phosphoribosyltransferase [Pseudothauera rhizosphaerae]|uniref:Nicotinate phosphoribosyltransferase n=1 Tax=Pseudothauera rhizosphaerae TaxID=2565932 RepID=A0A4S4ARY3_9RHOO|nr:nicotinate phosphoribosyltransferase [Pseudothauera rhizosphaerae]THF62623.1 nicotinate phosphoribosyltransferase [Pseudothauera rhizosphaerae]
MRTGDEALLTDFYQLTMLQAYFDEGLHGRAVFELFVRSLPPERGFLLLAGIEQALDYLENLRFGADELAWLHDSGRFPPDFVDRLAGFRFTGDVHAMREGSVFFANEPVLRVEAPIAEAQLVESRLINLVHYATLVASKAARCRLAAPGRLLVDFGLRRAHGAEAGLLAARAAWLAGFDGSATVLAGQRYGIPVYGTMAHSYIEAHAREADAFARFAASQPDNLTLLIDTYDTEEGARRVVELAPELARHGTRIRALRLDSGDLLDHARRVRRILDDGGLPDVHLFASGNLDEGRIAALLAADAPIDGFGVGTSLTTSADVPCIDAVYKLQAYDGRPRRKRSEGKATWPGAKQVWRLGGSAGDLVALHDEAPPTDAVPLLQPVMRAGRRLAPAEPLAALRAHAAEELARLPAALRTLDRTDSTELWPVRISPALQALAAELDREAH